MEDGDEEQESWTMDQKYKIRKNFTKLQETIDVNHFIPYLYQEMVLEEYDKQKIKAGTTGFEQAERLLDTIQKKANGYTYFYVQLQKVYPHLARLLQRTMQPPAPQVRSSMCNVALVDGPDEEATDGLK